MHSRFYNIWDCVVTSRLSLTRSHLKSPERFTQITISVSSENKYKFRNHSNWHLTEGEKCISDSRNRERYKLIRDRWMSPKCHGWVTRHYLDHLRSHFARSSNDPCFQIMFFVTKSDLRTDSFYESRLCKFQSVTSSRRFVQTLRGTLIHILKLYKIH